MLEYKVIIEKEGKSYGAYLPDVPGCVATGHSVGVVKKRISEALENHLLEMLSQGYSLPRSGSVMPFEGSNIVEIGVIEIDFRLWVHL